MKHLTKLLLVPLVFFSGWLASDWNQPPPVKPVGKSKFIELVQIVAPLGDPNNLATLKAESAAADRHCKISFYLNEAKTNGTGNRL